MKAVLAGTPNAGKTTLFNALTRSSLRTGNFHGVTTSAYSKTVGGVTYVDVPGAYSFSPYSLEERSALEEISSADLIINVVDGLTFLSSLNFTRRLVAENKNVVLYLTKLNRLSRRGGKVDAAKLSAYLGVPVFTDIKSLKNAIKFGVSVIEKPCETPRLDEAYTPPDFTLTRWEKLFLNNIFSALFFVAAILLTFFAAFHPSMPGAALKDLTEKLICENLCNLITAHMSNQPLISFLKEGVFGGAGAVLSFLPQLLILYFFLTFFDESGVTSSLSFTTDGLFEKVKLSGRAAFSLISGFGCTAAAILTTRGYSSESAQRRTIAILPFIPCGAKLPVFLTFLSPLFKNPFPAVACLYFAGLVLAFCLSALIGGGGEGLISEVAPIIFPSFKTVLNKLFFYLKGFIIKVSGTVLIFCTLSWLLSHFDFSLNFVPPERSVLSAFARVLIPLFKPMGIDDWRIAYAALSGFAAKENVAATISLLCPDGVNLSFASAMAFCAFMLCCPACISAFSSSVKEVGWAFTLKCFILQLIFSFAAGYLVRFLLSL